MKLQHILFATVACMTFATNVHAQSVKLKGHGTTPYIQLVQDTVSINFDNDFITVPIISNADYSIGNTSEWITTRKEKTGSLTVFGDYNFSNDSRFGSIDLISGDYTRTLTVKQAPMSGFTTDDIKITGVSGSASQSQSGQGIDKSLDNSTSTLYHSPWNGTTFPITLTYTFSTAQHVDYAIYTPRQDGNNNGNFQEVTIKYQLNGQTTWIDLKEINLSGSSSAARISFGEDGIDNVKRIQFVVKSGANGFAACAEMSFWQEDKTLKNLLAEYFEDALCTKLKEGVSSSTIASIKNPLVKKIVTTVLDENYTTKFRLGEFEPFRPLVDLRNELKNSHTYCNHENPTGITFKAGETAVIMVEGLEDDPISLQVRNFGPTDFTTNYYALHNGVNVVKIINKGNGYIDYYTMNYKTAPNVKIHFVGCTENGFFDLTKGMTNDDWKMLLANAQGDCLDFKTEYVIGTFPVSYLKKNTPKLGVEFATSYNNVIRYEREIMGLFKYNRVPKNHQTVITVESSGGLYHASNDGFCVPVNALNAMTTYPFEFWGAAHEFGHNNQTIGFVYTGLTEVTNNVHSAWCQHKLQGGYHRLEDESYGGPRGERFEAYLENGIRLGNIWQQQAGPDSYSKTMSKETVTDQDENGNSLSQVTTTKYEHDVFVKLVPLWQLMLYTEESCVGASPEAYAKFFEGLRTYTGSENSTNGKQQIKWMRTFCDSTKINFLPFFEKAGILKPAHFYQGDYSNGWIVITQKMIDDLKSYIEAKNYAEAPSGLNWITVYNMDRFKEKTPLTEGTINSGCTASGSNYIRVDNTVWAGAVGYETYDADNNHIANTVFGYNDSTSSTRYTYVKWPSGAKYIMAVGYDGSKIKIYQK